MKPKVKMEFEHQQIQTLLDNNLIEPSSSMYASPTLCVPKKGQESLRLVIDYRYINKFIADSAFPLPSVELIFQWLEDRHQYLSLVDLQKGHWQVPLAEESRKYLAFVSYFGLFQPKVLWKPRQQSCLFNCYVQRLQRNSIHKTPIICR